MIQGPSPWWGCKYVIILLYKVHRCNLGFDWRRNWQGICAASRVWDYNLCQYQILLVDGALSLISWTVGAMKSDAHLKIKGQSCCTERLFISQWSCWCLEPQFLDALASLSGATDRHTFNKGVNLRGAKITVTALCTYIWQSYSIGCQLSWNVIM